MSVTPEPMSPPHRDRAQPAFRVGGHVFRYLALDATMPDLPTLTRAERAVVELVAEGLDNQAIADRRGTSINTIGNQLASIFDKLGIASRFELAELVARLATTRGAP